jgi:hypothetical protein
MKNDFYVAALQDSHARGIWKTALHVEPSEMDSVSHKIRYRARQLGLSVTINTDKEEHTVSFLAS